MGISAAKVEANRRNALRSTGPRSARGKARVRGNGGERHGLARGVVVLSHVERARKQRRLRRWVESLRPGNEAERELVEEAVVASIVLDRIARIEAGEGRWWRDEVRDRFDADARAEAEEALALLDADPAVAVLVLERTPVGCGRLIEAIESLRKTLEPGAPVPVEAARRALRLLGRDPDDRYPDSLTARLTGRIPGPPVRGAQLAEVLDAEIARLAERRAALGPGFDAQRAWADEEARLPPATAVMVARHATRWSGRLHRALRTLRRLQSGRERDQEIGDTPQPLRRLRSCRAEEIAGGTRASKATENSMQTI